MKDNKSRTVGIPDHLWEMLHEIAIEENHGARGASLRTILEKVYEQRKKNNHKKGGQTHD